MRLKNGWVVAAILLLTSWPLISQTHKREPLTEAQIDEIREAGIDPPGRIALYTKYLNEHAEVIKGFISRGLSASRNRQLDQQLQDFTALMDELGSNLDMYSERHADIRKALKPLGESVQQWLAMLRGLKSEPAFEVARKESIESCEDLDNQVISITAEQADYFKQHKDESGQERAEPK
jgi:hypothetical protein